MTQDTSDSYRDSLFNEFTLNSTTLNNRVGLAPMTRISATDDGRATSEMAAYYAKFANGGFSFLLTEGTYPAAEGKGYDGQPGLATDEQGDAWKAIVEASHDAETPIFAQLMHAGPLVQSAAGEPVSPSAVTPTGKQLSIYGGEGSFESPRKLAIEELDEIKDGFVAAAKRAVAAGFDGVEIHGANGYLLDTFLSRHLNTRDDEYGGSIDARARFPREVLDAVLTAIPDDFVVGIRLSQTKVNDDEHRWTPTEAEIYLSTLDTGDYVHVTHEPITAPAFEGTTKTLCELAVTHAESPVIANGGLGDPDMARAVLESGVDLLTQARPALANHDWPARVRADEALNEFDFEATLLPTAEIKSFEVPPLTGSPVDD